MQIENGKLNYFLLQNLNYSISKYCYHLSISLIRRCLSQGRWKGMKYEKVDSGFPLDLFDKKMCMSEIRLRMLISF